jgi:hypothetical protein
LLALIKIQDGTREYSCRDIIPFNPGHFPELNNLELMGSNALSFNPATLASTKKLVTLKLYMPRVHCCFIPPIDELRRSYGLASEEEDGKGKDDGGNDANTSSSPFTIRPQWTWDWQLPALTHLYLNAEFAYWFEFKVLHGCPFLRELSLHMRTERGNHIRTITQADLFVPGSTSDGSTKERIVAPKLQKIYMDGCWSFEDSTVLPQFLGGMFPSLYCLTARAWDGVTVGSFVKVLRTTGGHIKSMTIFLPRPPVEEEVEIGVYLARYSNSGRDRDGLSNRLFISGREYVVRKEY